jgi:hypothetical protein
MATTNIAFTNNAASTLAAGINSSVTSLTVAAGTGSLFPTLSGTDYYYCTLANNAGTVEIVKVTARSTDTFTIVRGQDNTTAVSWSLGDKVELRLNAASLQQFPQKQNNLGDLPSASTARTNLGLVAIASSGSASDLSTGTTPLARLGSGGTPSTKTYLRGDNTWATPLYNGATVTSGSSDITLTAASTQIQRVTMTASGKKITLPDATTMDHSGHAAFIIENLSAVYDIDICDNAGNYVGVVPAGKGSIIGLANISSVNTAWTFGQWYISDVQPFLDISVKQNGIGFTATENYTPLFHVAAASSTVLVAVFVNAANNDLYIIAGSVSGNTVSWGTAQVIGVSTYTTRVRICPLSATTGLFTGNTTTPTQVYYAYSLSGTTFTTSTSATAGSSVRGDFVALDSTRALAIYSSGVRVVTSNGTGAAPSLGSGVADTLGKTAAILLDTDKTVYMDTTNRNIRVATTSNTAVTLGTAIVAPTTPAYDAASASGVVPDLSMCWPEGTSMYKLSTTSLMSVTVYGGIISTQTFSVSGSTISLSSSTSYNFNALAIGGAGSSVASYAASITWLSATDIIVAFGTIDGGSVQGSTSYSYCLQRFTFVSGTGFVPVGQPLQTAQNNYQMTTAVVLSSTKAVVGNPLNTNVVTALT